jgi:hypothetical protein
LYLKYSLKDKQSGEGLGLLWTLIVVVCHENPQYDVGWIGSSTSSRTQVSATAEFKIEEFSKKLRAKNISPTTIDRFIEYIKSAEDLDLSKIRIIALAREWQIVRDLSSAFQRLARKGPDEKYPDIQSEENDSRLRVSS